MSKAKVITAAKPELGFVETGKPNFTLEKIFKLGGVAHTFNPTLRRQADGFLSSKPAWAGQLGLHRKILSQKKNLVAALF